MLARTFEIKIALLGNVSAGKTTVLNALFCDKFSEVSMKRTTAGINLFRVHSLAATTGGEPKSSSESSDASVESLLPPTRTAESILKEVSQDNIRLRKGDEIQEKVFDIQVKQDLVPMRNDTRLVFVDIPGINEANVVNKYKDYVSENWESYDSVIVVMDARLGVNTEDQVFLLSFVKEQLKKKEIPVIILCNKVDDPEDEEQAELVKEARNEVEKIFSANCREKALNQVLQKKGKYNDRTLLPAFIPVSAIHAFIHQSASLMSRESFNNFDKDLLEKLGREQIGRRRWNRLSETQKYDEAYKVVKEGHQDGMEDSNFDKLLTVLNFILGGHEAQKKVIELQIWTAVRSLSKRPFPPGGVTALVKDIYEKRKALQASDKVTLQVIASLDLVTSFWSTYKSYEDESFQIFKSDFPKGVGRLTDIICNLVDYHKLACLPDWNDTSSHAISEMKKLIRRYFTTLIELQQKDKSSCAWGRSGTSAFLAKSKTTGMTPHDWCGVWGSLMLLSYSKQFNEIFGQEKIIIDRLFIDANGWSRNHFDGVNCPTCQKTLTVAHGTQSKCCRSCLVVYSEDPLQGMGKKGKRYCPGCKNNITTDPYCDNCGATYQYKTSIAPLEPWYNAEGRLLPYKSSTSASCTSASTVVAPTSFSDPLHIAHIVWTFCTFLEALETKK